MSRNNISISKIMYSKMPTKRKISIFFGFGWPSKNLFHVTDCRSEGVVPANTLGERTGLVVRASDSGSGDPGSILGRVGVLFP